ncbi:exopolysaccharide biosynthesis protein [Leuconostoc lactis]|uniref:YveK family protein n=1 Tax=Leuconostoc lactis TaxID=1246 RepID=UPI00114455F3|nr:Wzz/FepE/Etk N-terminal domain-containing protein [Leuconostoc lactis]GEB41009.1 exopolysaccharide biosynthesis protein [Leuconostoc lactis]GLY44972.1 exopolysaccharide biosynthesis protein [Leuconostoc lactis]
MNNVLELRQLWDIIRKHLVAILFMAIIGAGLGFAIAEFLIAPTYSASTSMLVNRSNDNNNASVNLSDQQADVQIINTYKNLVISSNVLGDVSKKLKHPEPIVVQKAKPAEYRTLADGTQRLISPAQKEITKPSAQKPYNLSVDKLKKMVTISNQQNSQVFAINVKAKNAKEAAVVANTVADAFKSKIGDFMKINNVSIIDSAKASNVPVAPNKKLFTLAGLVLLGGLTFLVVLAKELSDTTVKNPDEVSQLFGLTNLGAVGHIRKIKHFDMSMANAVSAEQDGLHSRSRLSRLQKD